MAIAAGSIDITLLQLRIWQACISSRQVARAAFPSLTMLHNVRAHAEDAIDRAKAEPCSDAPLVGRCHDERFLVNVRCAEEVMRALRRAEARARPLQISFTWVMRVL